MGAINSFALSPEDQNKVISVGQERKITYWDLQKSDPEAVINSSSNPGENDELFSIDISKDGQLFATGGSLGVLRIWSYSEGVCLVEHSGHSNTITCVKFTPDSKQLVTTGRDGLVLVWNIFSS
jgi:WD40 repeat protein